MVALAIERVQTLGGQCQKQEKKKEFYEIDLSHWQGTDADLALLLPFRLLAEDNQTTGTPSFALSNPTSPDVLVPRRLCRARFWMTATTESPPPKKCTFRLTARAASKLGVPCVPVKNAHSA